MVTLINLSVIIETKMKDAGPERDQSQCHSSPAAFIDHKGKKNTHKKKQKKNKKIRHHQLI